MIDFQEDVNFEEQPKQVNPLSDIGRSFVGGISFGQRALYPVAQKINPELTKEEYSKYFPNMYYEPQTGLGNISKFAGEIAPWLLVPELKGANIFATGAKTGGVYGGVASGLGSLEQKGINPEKNLSDISSGIIGGSALGLAIPSAIGISKNAGNSILEVLEKVTGKTRGMYNHLTSPNTKALELGMTPPEANVVSPLQQYGMDIIKPLRQKAQAVQRLRGKVVGSAKKEAFERLGDTPIFDNKIVTSHIDDYVAGKSQYAKAPNALEKELIGLKDRLSKGIQQSQKNTQPLPPPKDNYLKDLSEYTPTLHREMAPSEADKLIGNTLTDMTGDRLYFSNKPELALGQGKNKGVILEFDSKGIQGQINTEKPTWNFDYANGNAEFVSKHTPQSVYRQNVKSVTIKPGARFTPAENRRFVNSLKGWNKVANEDGSITFLNPARQNKKAMTPKEAQGVLDELDDLINYKPSAGMTLSRQDKAIQNVAKKARLGLSSEMGRKFGLQYKNANKAYSEIQKFATPKGINDLNGVPDTTENVISNIFRKDVPESQLLSALKNIGGATKGEQTQQLIELNTLLKQHGYNQNALNQIEDFIMADKYANSFNAGGGFMSIIPGIIRQVEKPILKTIKKARSGENIIPMNDVARAIYNQINKVGSKGLDILKNPNVQRAMALNIMRKSVEPLYGGIQMNVPYDNNNNEIDFIQDNGGM